MNCFFCLFEIEEKLDLVEDRKVKKSAFHDESITHIMFQ